MNNLNFIALANFKRILISPKVQSTDNCSANCPTQIQGLPLWINNQPFWTYQCACCQTYQFKPGQIGGFDD